jgi:hypothetical protein
LILTGSCGFFRTLQRALLPVALALLAGLGSARAADPLPGVTPFQITSYAANSLSLLQQSRFEILAGQFHYPETLAAAMVKAEQAQLTAVLERAGALFGVPRQQLLLDGPRQADQFVVQGLTQAYWNDRDRYSAVSYQVDFSREGRGYLTFSIIVYDHRLQLRSVAFGLPAELPGSKQRLEDLRSRLLNP